MPQSSAYADQQMIKHFGIETEENEWEPAAYNYLSGIDVKDVAGQFWLESRIYWDAKAMAALNYLAEEWDYAYAPIEDRP